MRKYIITEGQTETRFLARILPIEVLIDTKIVAAGGYSAALSLTRSLLMDNVDKVILFLDSDTNEERQIVDKLIFIHEYLRLNTISQKRVRTIFAIPHFESFIFSIPAIVKKYFPNLTDTDLTHLKYNPSGYKFKDDLKSTVKDLIERLDESDIKLYRDSGYISAMINSLNGIEDEDDDE